MAEGLTDWLTHGMTADSVAEWFNGGLHGWLFVGWRANYSIEQLDSWVTDWLADWLSDWMGELLTDWSTGWLTHTVNVKTAAMVLKFDAQRMRVCIDLRRSHDRNTSERWCNVTSQVHVQNVRLSYIRGRWGGRGGGALHRLLGMYHCYVMVLHLTLKLPRSDC